MAGNDSCRLICNDDIIFTPGSVKELIKGTKEFFICSPKNPNSQFNRGLQAKYSSGRIIGYRTSEHFSGWCHLINKKIFEKFPIDLFWHSNFGGYFQDDWIGMLCQVDRIPIGLCADSIVEHNECASSPHADDRTYFDMKQVSIFKRTQKLYLNGLLKW